MPSPYRTRSNIQPPSSVATATALHMASDQAGCTACVALVRGEELFVANGESKHSDYLRRVRQAVARLRFIATLASSCIRSLWYGSMLDAVPRTRLQYPNAHLRYTYTIHT